MKTNKKPSGKKVAKGTIIWEDEEFLGYRCNCGEEITLGADYEDDDNRCPKCKKKYSWEKIINIYEL